MDGDSDQTWDGLEYIFKISDTESSASRRDFSLNCIRVRFCQQVRLNDLASNLNWAQKMFDLSYVYTRSTVEI